MTPLWCHMQALFDTNLEITGVKHMDVLLTWTFGVDDGGG